MKTHFFFFVRAKLFIFVIGCSHLFGVDFGFSYHNNTLNAIYTSVILHFESKNLNLVKNGLISIISLPIRKLMA